MCRPSPSTSRRFSTATRRSGENRWVHRYEEEGGGGNILLYFAYIVFVLPPPLELQKRHKFVITVCIKTLGVGVEYEVPSGEKKWCQ